MVRILNGITENEKRKLEWLIDDNNDKKEKKTKKKTKQCETDEISKGLHKLWSILFRF